MYTVFARRRGHLYDHPFGAPTCECSSLEEALFQAAGCEAHPETMATIVLDGGERASFMARTITARRPSNIRHYRFAYGRFVGDGQYCTVEVDAMDLAGRLCRARVTVYRCERAPDGGYRVTQAWSELAMAIGRKEMQ